MKNQEDKDDTSTGKRQKGEMHFLDHLEEFRWVVIRSLIAFLIGCGVVLAFVPIAADILSRPLTMAELRMGKEIGSLVTISPLGAFTVLLQAALLGGLSLSLPFILYFIASFLAPGLTAKERRVLIPGCLLGMFLFLLGASFSYFFILPLSVFVSLQFNELLGLEIVWSASEYYSFVVWMILAIGGSFQFPLLLLLLQYVEIVTPNMLRGIRHMVVVVILIAAAIITPSDPISMMILAVPLYLLYEFSIFVGQGMLKRKRAREKDEGIYEGID